MSVYIDFRVSRFAETIHVLQLVDRLELVIYLAYVLLRWVWSLEGHSLLNEKKIVYDCTFFLIVAFEVINFYIRLEILICYPPNGEAL